MEPFSGIYFDRLLDLYSFSKNLYTQIIQLISTLTIETILFFSMTDPGVASLALSLPSLLAIFWQSVLAVSS